MTTSPLDGLDGLVCDLDGVLYRGSQPIPGAASAVETLRRRGIRLVFATNNATATVEERIGRMKAVGIEALPEELVTSAVVTAEHLQADGRAGASAFVIGKSGVRHALASVGIEMADGDDGEWADIVVVSGDDTFDYAAMRTAARAVRRGALFVATNDDATFPAPDGLWPGAGAIVAAIVTASGASPIVMGKPHRPMMEACARRLEGCRRIGVVGDQPATDLAGADEMGWRTVLVLSGVTTADDAARLVWPPDVVLGSIAELDLLR